MHKKLLLALSVILIPALVTENALAKTAATMPSKKPSSDIPERREFPVNPTIKPCEDFYAYTCSEALSGFKLRDDRSKHTFSFSDSSERLLKKKEQFLGNLKTSKDHLSPRSETLKTVFNSCLNSKASAKEERSIVETTKSEINNINSRQAYTDFLAKNYRAGHPMVWDFDDIANQDDPKQSDVSVLPDFMTLPERSYYANEALIKDYKDVLTDFFKTLKWDHPEKRAENLIALEKSYAQVFPLPAEFRELLTKRLNISKADLLKKYPGIGLENLMGGVPDNVQVREFSAASIKWLSDELNRADTEKTGYSTLRDHLAWHSLAHVMDDAYPEFFKRLFQFNKKHLGGADKRPPRSERCTQTVMNEFGREIDAELIDVVFPNFPAEKVTGLGEKIRQAIIARMEKSDWLSSETRKEGIAKVKAMKLQLVKPKTDEEWDFNLPAEYKKDQPYANRFTVVAKRREKMLQRIGKPRNPDVWGMGPLTVNAYYNPTVNKFVMPIGILQYPFFDVSAPDEINLGAVGVVLGHEMGHGIDDKGSHYDKDGKLRQWMKDEEVKTFVSRGDHLVEQFNKIGHNGKLTLGENMADLSGLTFAWDAAFPESKGRLEDKQGFYLQYARLWCETMRPKYREMKLKTDPHAVGEARVNEQMKHQTGFFESYSCKASDKLWLEPAARVKIW